MIQLLYIAIGGAAGALSRYGMANGIHALFGRAFPYGTLAVNVIGSLIMGFVFILMVERMETSPEWRAGIFIGLLGAFTTFSTFSIETLNLLEAGESMKAGLNIILSVSLCLSGCWLGMVLGRQL